MSILVAVSLFCTVLARLNTPFITLIEQSPRTAESDRQKSRKRPNSAHPQGPPMPT
jgi:hypothetical protein